MNKVIIFFRHHEDTGETVQLDLRCHGVPHQVFVYSRSVLDSTYLSQQKGCEYPTEESYAAFLRQLLERLAQEGDGGIAVDCGMGGSSWISTYIGAVGMAESGQGGYFLLQPGRLAKFHGFHYGETIQMRKGSCLVLPVDDEAQQQLTELVNSLHWLSPDIEALVLNTIWRPALETRIAALEQKADLKPLGSTRRQEKSTIGTRLRGWSRHLRPLGYGFAVVVALFLLVNGIAQKRQLESIRQAIEGMKPATVTEPLAPAEEVDAPGEDLAAADGAESEGEEEGPEEKPVAERGSLLNRFHETLAKFPEDSAFRRIYDSHLRELAGKPPAEMVGDDRFAWGLVKILAIERALPVSRAVQTNVRQRSATKRLLERMREDIQPPERSMLAFVLCSAFGVNRSAEVNKAGLPYAPDDFYRDRVEIPIQCDSEDASAAAAATGFQNLIQSLEERL